MPVYRYALKSPDQPRPHIIIDRIFDLESEALSFGYMVAGWAVFRDQVTVKVQKGQHWHSVKDFFIPDEWRKALVIGQPKPANTDIYKTNTLH